MGALGGGGGAISSGSTSGGQFFRQSADEVRQLESKPPGRRNVFISFHVEDEAQVNLLRAQATNSDFGMEFRDYSVKEPFDEAWRSNCRDRIAQTSLTIVMVGPGTANREAVDWEIEESYRQGHKVIGVRIFRDRDDPIPPALTRHNAPILLWNRDDIATHLT
jgi:hypothetical protein